LSHSIWYKKGRALHNGEIDDSIRRLLRISRENIERCQKTEYALVSSLERDPLLKERIRRPRMVPGVGPITALNWANHRLRPRTFVLMHFVMMAANATFYALKVIYSDQTAVSFIFYDVHEWRGWTIATRIRPTSL
jgi:hypothetical protein